MQSRENIRAFGFDPIARMNEARERKPGVGGNVYKHPTRHFEPHELKALCTPKMIVNEWRKAKDEAIHLYRLFAYEPDFDWSSF